jgi:hypothetical protein
MGFKQFSVSFVGLFIQPVLQRENKNIKTDQINQITINLRNGTIV